MSLAELTRNCFQSGIYASKWLSLCKHFISKQPIIQGSPSAERALSNSVLVLYRSYPGDPALHEYLKFALEDGFLSIPLFTATFLQAARSPDLHSSATLDNLCQTILNAHYATGLPPTGSLVPFTDSPVNALDMAQDAMALFRTAHSLPVSQFHHLLSSSSQLLVLLISCATDVSQVSTAQAMVHFADANDILQNFRLTPDVRQALETFVLSLSIIIGDDVKAAKEAQSMQSVQMAIGKGDLISSSSNTDIVTFSLILHHMVVTSRASDFGSGSGRDPVAVLVGTFRWMSLSPQTFYTQILLSALTCLSQSSQTFTLWKAFVVGRLPWLLASFEGIMRSDSAIVADWQGALQGALAVVLRRTDIISACEQSGAANGLQQEDDGSRSLTKQLLQQFIVVRLVEAGSAAELDSTITNDTTPRLFVEAHDAGVDPEALLEAKLAPELSLEDVAHWIDRVWRDPSYHHLFAKVILKRFQSLSSSLDVESLSHLCKILYTSVSALDIFALHERMSDLVFHALSFLDKFDCETVGNPQTAVSHFGDVVLLLQYILSRFHLDSNEFKKDARTFSSSFLRSTDAIYSVDTLTQEDAAVFNAWFKALFDSGSEGIEDTILRSTQPKALLRISTTLVSHAIKANLSQKFDGDVLNNGVAYFTGPLLNWTLVGVIKVLAGEIERNGFTSPVHLEVLQTLLLAPSCPQPVLQLCGSRILGLLADRRLALMAPTLNIDVESLRRSVTAALGMKSNNIVHRSAWLDFPKQSIHEALLLARSGKAPSLDVERCLKSTTPPKFLQTLWTTLSVTASLGEIENSKRVATFIFTMPRCHNTPPLMPIFIHTIVPSLIAAIDRQSPAEQAVNCDLFVGIIVSVFTAALHMEWALRTVSHEHRAVWGQPCMPMARRLANELRSRKQSSCSDMVLQRLGMLPSFVANFPVFTGEISL